MKRVCQIIGQGKGQDLVKLPPLTFDCVVNVKSFMTADLVVNSLQ